jgi:hypothetical protein
MQPRLAVITMTPTTIRPRRSRRAGFAVGFVSGLLAGFTPRTPPQSGQADGAVSRGQR